VLSWVERSRALLLFTLAYLAIELAPITIGSAGIAPASPGRPCPAWPSPPRSSCSAPSASPWPSSPVSVTCHDRPARQHPVNSLDDVVHQRVRLGILTVAHQARRVEFGFLRTNLDLTAGNLGNTSPSWRKPD